MRDEFSEEIKRSLANRAGNRCSNPRCGASTSGPQENSAKAVNVGVAAHITSAAPGGPRYNADLTSEQRRHMDNGIWLCQNCAKDIDSDEAFFTKDVIRAWKTIAENEARSTLGRARTPLVESEVERKIRAISEWTGKRITHAVMNSGHAVHVLGPVQYTYAAHLLECTELYVKILPMTPNSIAKSIPLTKIDVAYDDRNNCLELQQKNN
jgi:hypothetical protein